jgi:hypothetical protein
MIKARKGSFFIETLICQRSTAHEQSKERLLLHRDAHLPESTAHEQSKERLLLHRDIHEQAKHSSKGSFFIETLICRKVQLMSKARKGSFFTETFMSKRTSAHEQSKKKAATLHR